MQKLGGTSKQLTSQETIIGVILDALKRRRRRRRRRMWLKNAIQYPSPSFGRLCSGSRFSRGSSQAAANPNQVTGSDLFLSQIRTKETDTKKLELPSKIRFLFRRKKRRQQRKWLFRESQQQQRVQQYQQQQCQLQQHLQLQ